MHSGVAQPDIPRWSLATHHGIIIGNIVFGCVACLAWVSLLVLVSMERNAHGLLSEARGLQVFSDIGTFRVLSAGLSGIMLLLTLMPVLFVGFGHLLLPKGLGMRAASGRSLSVVAFWLLVVAVCLVPVSVFVSFGGEQQSSTGAAGWAVYAPLTVPQGPALFASGAIVLILALGLSYLSLMLTAVSFTMTFFASRRKGTKLAQVQPHVWLYLVAALLVLILLPIEAFKLSLLLIESYKWSPSFFNLRGGGPDWVTYLQHFLVSQPPWSLMFLPALGAASAAVSVCAGRSMVLAPVMAVSSGVLGVGSLGLASEPFVLQTVGGNYHAIVSLALGGGILFLLVGWIGTLAVGHWRGITPVLWVAGFAILLLAGVGIYLLRSAAIDATALFYTLVHLHFVVSASVLFALFAAWYAFFPEITGFREITGRRYLPALGILQFLFAFAGAVLVFTYFAYHPLGLGETGTYVVDRNDLANRIQLMYTYPLGIYLAVGSLLPFVLSFILARKQEGAAAPSGST
jgi:heme/copper-type cytochrome/quinol oxidase subunit 1